MKQLDLFPKPPKYAKRFEHKPNPYIVLGTWGLAHLAKCAVNTSEPKVYRDVAKCPPVASAPREPTFSSRWRDPYDSDE